MPYSTDLQRFVYSYGHQGTNKVQKAIFGRVVFSYKDQELQKVHVNFTANKLNNVI